MLCSSGHSGAINMHSICPQYTRHVVTYEWLAAVYYPVCVSVVVAHIVPCGNKEVGGPERYLVDPPH